MYLLSYIYVVCDFDILNIAFRSYCKYIPRQYPRNS